MRRNDSRKIGRSRREVLADHKTGFGMNIPRIKSRHADFEVEIASIAAVGVSETIGVVPHIAAPGQDL